MIKTFKNFATAMWQDESGISSVEYALLLAFIAAGIVLAADQLGDAVGLEIQNAADCIGTSDPALCT